MPKMSLQQNIINNLSDFQRSFLRMSDKKHVIMVKPKKAAKSPKDTAPTDKTVS
jgi:hypothetical protein